ncbi:TIGR02281 family clan AA aspartic protease [Sphingomonas bacterium]|uniref:TIGR02281 family clan AA aspartic protease n=1 Tax=Sphingomonas bacterium TaxID=1895847 RepID=UPI0015769BA3|nr:TIGR02281 family clan AA aspartic protease [Sphingomonas bacterium]
MSNVVYLSSFLIALVATPVISHGVQRDASPVSPIELAAPIFPPAPAERDERSGMVIQRSADGLFYVQAHVNGALVQFVVDSGSSVVVLSAEDASRADIGGDEAVDVDTAGGASAMRRAQIKHVELAGQKLSNVDAAIVNRNLKVSLLGQSALSQLTSVTFRGNQLELQ